MHFMIWFFLRGKCFWLVNPDSDPSSKKIGTGFEIRQFAKKKSIRIRERPSKNIRIKIRIRNRIRNSDTTQYIKQNIYRKAKKSILHFDVCANLQELYRALLSVSIIETS